ncbi:NUDIX domain-containing protein [Streptomyces chryseus]
MPGSCERGANVALKRVCCALCARVENVPRSSRCGPRHHRGSPPHPEGRVRGGAFLASRASGSHLPWSTMLAWRGHVEANESAIAAVAREAAEELGIAVRAEDLECVHVAHHRHDDDRSGICF